MAREKATKGKAPGQKSIKSFFPPPKKTKPEATDESDAASESANEVPADTEADASMTEDNSDVDMDEDIPKEEKKKATKAPAADPFDLPPINEIPIIFDDLVSHIPDIKTVVEHIQGRKLRVATMCSGTESPLLALELIQKSILAQHGLNFEIEHVFSCEIEPFKQAYIERNFRPPLLFRDVCELGDGEAYVLLLANTCGR